MLNRQRVILEFIRKASGPVGRTAMMKWLFLLKNETPVGKDQTFYDFVPYHYGPYSILADREITQLESKGFINGNALRIPIQSEEAAADETAKLSKNHRRAVAQVFETYGQRVLRDLLDDVYRRYPWYASRSKLTERNDQIHADRAVYTIGYEGRSIDRFLDLLLSAGVQRIIDVRKNAYSRKYGFIGAALKKHAESMDIQYSHVPQVGIPSGLRQRLESAEDYAQLFAHYKQEILPEQTEFLDAIGALLSEKPSTLLCYEADPVFCHRGVLATSLSDRTHLEIKHL